MYHWSISSAMAKSAEKTSKQDENAMEHKEKELCTQKKKKKIQYDLN